MKKQFVHLMIILFVSLLAQTTLLAQKTTERNLNSFEKVKIGGGFKVTIQQGSSENIKITASGIDLEDIITEVEGSTLNIRTRNDKWDWKNNYDVDIILTYKSIESISSSGSSKIYVKSKIKSTEFELRLSGSGKFEGEVEVERLEVSLSGSGDVEIAGSAKEQNISISGSGDVEAMELKASSTKISISGSGNAKVYASEELDARVTGSGDVRFAGNPQKQIFKSTGSGSIRKVN
jgi:hypothetical protein